MTERETMAFRITSGFYDKWRDTVIETDEQWEQFAEDIGRMASELEKVRTPLAVRLMMAVIDTFGDLYRNGMKPVAESYFGRDDM